MNIQKLMVGRMEQRISGGVNPCSGGLLVSVLHRFQLARPGFPYQCVSSWLAQIPMVVIAILFLCAPLPAQHNSRFAEIEDARARKAQSLQPDDSSKIEQGFLFVKDKKILERFTEGIAGFRVKLGGLVSGSGFALGPEYLRRDWDRGKVGAGVSQPGFFQPTS